MKLITSFRIDAQSQINLYMPVFGEKENYHLATPTPELNRFDEGVVIYE